MPPNLQGTYAAKALKNLEWLDIESLIPIGGGDTLSYAVRLCQETVKVVAVPKTMDNDFPGTDDYCIGFSTASPGPSR